MTQSSRPPIPPPTPQTPSAPQTELLATSQTEQMTGQINPVQSGESTYVVQPPAAVPPPPQRPPQPKASKSTPAAPPARAKTARRIPTPSPGNVKVQQLIAEAFKAGYSDIHLGVGEIPRMRDRGEMVITEYPQTDIRTFMSWLYEVLTEEEIERFKATLEFDRANQYDFARVRVNVFDSLKGPAMVLRLIPLKILTLEQLRLPEVFKKISDAHKGLVLVTGPTGSGKSTTMAAMVDYVNKNHAKHIITIEDPVEFVHQSRKSLIKQREVGIHTRKFDNALKAALREDPDVILIGEMRDRETVNTALKAAQTGHLVMGTLHTNSAVKTLERILSLYSAEEQDAMRVALAESLVSIISQGLCRTTDGKRAAYHDIMVNTETIKDYVRQGKNDEILELMKDGEFDGMITTNQSLFNLYQEGRITEETALERSPTPNEMAQMLRGRV